MKNPLPEATSRCTDVPCNALLFQAAGLMTVVTLRTSSVGRITLPAFTIANAAPQRFTFGQVLCVDRECSLRAWHLPSWAANHVLGLCLYLSERRFRPSLSF
jgi:hypothetical protein